MKSKTPKLLGKRYCFEVGVVVVGALNLATVAPAFAQSAAGVGHADDGGITITEIIVTAQRRDESLSKTPVSVSVVTAETLARAQIVTETDLRAATPGLAVRATLNSNQLNYSLRGQSQDAFSGTRPGVLPYINDVQIGFGSAGGTAFYDLESVQVLKGPQGTLFGRSATGGAVLFTTAKPTDKLSGYVSALGGRLDALKVEGAVGGPIAGDNLKARLAGFYSRRDGYQQNLFDNSREGDYKRYGVRGTVSASLGGGVTNDLMVDYYDAKNGSTVSVISGLLPFTGSPPPYVPLELLYAGSNSPTATATGIATLTNFLAAAGPFAGPLAQAGYTSYFSNPDRPANGLRGALNDQIARGPYVVDIDAINTYRATNVIIINTTTFELGANTKLKNIFGHTHLRSDTQYDIDGTPFGVGANGIRATGGRAAFDPADACACTTVRQLSDELQLSGKAADDKLDYVVGAFYSNEESVNFWRQQFFDLIGAALQPIGAAAPSGVAQDQHLDFRYKNRTTAAYAQTTYQLNDRGLSVTGGVRYTDERVNKFTYPTDSGALALGPNFVPDQTKSYGRVSWTFGIQDQVSDQVLLYAVSRRAYKSGGYNGSVQSLPGSATTGGDAYDDERITDVEAGLKFNGRTGGMPTRLGLAVYRNWLRNSQRTAYSLVNNSPAGLTVNVPSGKVYGAEFEAMIKPIEKLTLGGSFNITRASFPNGNVVVNGVPQVFDRVPDTPRTSGSLFADVNLPVSPDLAIQIHGDLYHQAKSFTGPRSANADGTTMSGYTIANFRIGIGDTSKGWALNANLKNAFDKVYYIGGVNSGEVYQINTLVPGEPRTWTIEARYNF